MGRDHVRGSRRERPAPSRGEGCRISGNPATPYQFSETPISAIAAEVPEIIVMRIGTGFAVSQVMRIPSAVPRVFWSGLALSLWLATPARAELGATCTSDATCGADETCQVTSTSGSGGCDSAGDNDKCFTDPVVEGKTCVATVRTCTTDSECPSPTECADAGNGAVSFDGTTETRTPGTKVCTWKPKVCTADSECGDPRYGCIEVGREETCSDSGGNDDGPAPADGQGGGSSGAGTSTNTRDPSAAAPAAPEENPAADAPAQCEVTRVLKACMPKPVACATDAQCSGGWKCVDVTELDDGPYDRAASTSYCMPEGVRLAISGHVAIDDSAFNIGRDGGTKEGASGTAGPKSAVNDGDDTSDEDSGGCSFGGSQTNGAASLAVMVLAAVLGLRRRVRRRQ